MSMSDGDEECTRYQLQYGSFASVVVEEEV